MITIRTSLAVCLLVALETAAAQWRCDCTTIVAGCRAQVTVQDRGVEVTTDQDSCARVDYFIDGLPFVALVVDGRARQDWISPTAAPQVLVQSCQVCADRLREQPGKQGPIPTRPGRAATGAEHELSALIQVPPRYPDSAKARGLEGYVVVEFELTPYGTVEAPRVVESQPSRIFDAAALAAIRRWRYPEALEAAQQRVVRERLDFRISDLIWTQPGGPARRLTTASRPGPQNACVREGVTYNFGEVVEVGLINACIDPVVLFSCAAGLGKDLGRWRCGSAARGAVVLVRPGDGRSGRRATIGEYAENHSLLRPPNTEYWWLACREDDAQCRQAGHDWSNQLDGRPATVNPARVSRLRVARSL